MLGSPLKEHWNVHHTLSTHFRIQNFDISSIESILQSEVIWVFWNARGGPSPKGDQMKVFTTRIWETHQCSRRGGVCRGPSTVTLPVYLGKVRNSSRGGFFRLNDASWGLGESYIARFSPTCRRLS